MPKKQCPICKGDGFNLVGENPHECICCDGTGEVDAKYPLFKRHHLGRYKILSENLAVQVYETNEDGGADVGFTDVKSTISRVINGGQDIPETTFLDAYTRALNDISKAVTPDEPDTRPSTFTRT